MVGFDTPVHLEIQLSLRQSGELSVETPGHLEMP